MSKENKVITRANDDCLRAGNRDDAQEQGIIEGYFARWGQVDSHNTRFQKGCFAKSISERMNKIVVRNSHGNPVGKPLEIREDDKGAFFSGQLSLEVQEAREAFALVRDEVVTGLSFGFQNVNDKIEKDGIRTFTEVKLLEISPTWLPSGDDSRITSVRDGETADEIIEERSEDFSETVLAGTGPLLWGSIQETVSDIWWSWIFGELDAAETLAAMDKALNDFHASYLEFTSNWIQLQTSDDDSMRASPVNALQQAVASTLKEEERTVEDFAAEYKLTDENVKQLCRGQHIVDLPAVSNLPTELRTLNNTMRATTFENSFTELRQFMSEPELKRSNALLAILGNKQDNCSERSGEGKLNTDLILTTLKNINGDDSNV